MNSCRQLLLPGLLLTIFTGAPLAQDPPGPAKVEKRDEALARKRALELARKQLEGALDQQRVKREWDAHIEDNKRKITAGEVGTVVVQLPHPFDREGQQPIRVHVTEVVPQAIRAEWAIRLVVTHHFVRSARAVNGRLEIDGVPIGLDLEVEVWPEDESAEKSKRSVKGPAIKGQRIAVEVPVATPYPSVTGTLLAADGTPVSGCEVAVEIRTDDSVRYEQVRTDAMGRFQARVRVTATAGEALAVTVVPGLLIRKGSWRLYVIEMPDGPRTDTSVDWPIGPQSELGELRLSR